MTRDPPEGRDGFGAYYYLEVPARARRPARRSRMRGHEIPKGDPQVKGKMSACGLGSTRGRKWKPAGSERRSPSPRTKTEFGGSGRKSVTCNACARLGHGRWYSNETSNGALGIQWRRRRPLPRLQTRVVSTVCRYLS